MQQSPGTFGDLTLPQLGLIFGGRRWRKGQIARSKEEMEDMQYQLAAERMEVS